MYNLNYTIIIKLLLYRFSHTKIRTNKQIPLANIGQTVYLHHQVLLSLTGYRFPWSTV